MIKGSIFLRDKYDVIHGSLQAVASRSSGCRGFGETLASN
jgi:hypothetical protein